MSTNTTAGLVDRTKLSLVYIYDIRVRHCKLQLGLHGMVVDQPCSLLVDALHIEKCTIIFYSLEFVSAR